MENKVFIKKKYLIFREDAKKLTRDIAKKNNKEIVIDFSEVVFMSRSFVDKLLAQIEKQKKDIKFSKLDSSSLKFISKIKQTRAKIQKTLSHL